MSFISEFQIEDGGTPYKFKDSHAHLYLTCSTARNAIAKVVNCTGFELFTGVRATVRFTDTTTTDPASGNLTLNINNTGAKNIVIANSNNTIMDYTYSSEFCDNNACEFMYDGTNYIYLNRDTSGSGGADLTGTDTNNIMLVTFNN